MNYTQEELVEAKRQIVSVLYKLRKTLETLKAKENPERYRSQITLAERRIKAFSIAEELLSEKIDS